MTQTQPKLPVYLAGGTKSKKWCIDSTRSSETLLVKLFISHKGWAQRFSLKTTGIKRSFRSVL